MRAFMATLVCCAALTSASAQAQQPYPKAVAAHSAASASISIVLDAGSGRVIQTNRAMTNLFAADPKVVEVRPASPTSVFIFGIAPGRTTVAAVDQAGKVIGQYEVTVKPTSYGATEAQSAVHRALPSSNVQIQTSTNGLTLTGQARNAAEAEQISSTVKGYLADKQTLNNQLSVSSSVQVNLRVRVAEISRQVTRQFGINWSALGTIGRYGVLGATISDPFSSASAMPNRVLAGYDGKQLSINTLLDLLAQDNLATILAEPNLTAISGESASFLSGGEYPIPVAQQNNTVTIEYKQYGISLAFVPTVIGSDHISLHVRPEVSQLTTQGAVQLSAGNSTISVPALIVRRADTTVELGSGQSFAIAGLTLNQNTIGSSGLPYASESPVFGALFGSSSSVRSDTELVIIVTPYIVRPVDDPRRLGVPTDTYVPPDDYERVILQRQRGRTIAPDLVTNHLQGGAGFILN